LSDLRIKSIHYALPKRALTALAGFLAQVKVIWIKNYLIRSFIARFKVDMQEAAVSDLSAYPDFNCFFTRQLKPGRRKIAPVTIVSPVDGVVSECGEIQAGLLLQAKGRTYALAELLGCSPEACSRYEGGAFVTLYLSPRDYHRVHMPMDAVLESMTYLPGALFSVQPATVRVIPHLFARNKRLAVFFETDFGPMVMVMVGATIVGSITTAWQGEVSGAKKQSFDYSQLTKANRAYQKGAEMGYFKCGSTVILICPPGIEWRGLSSLHAGFSVQQGQALLDREDSLGPA
jgi:phosphatidylserine decarboxylase